MRETVKEKVNMFDVGGMAMDWFTLYCMCHGKLDLSSGT